MKKKVEELVVKYQVYEECVWSKRLRGRRDEKSNNNRRWCGKWGLKVWNIWCKRMVIFSRIWDIELNVDGLSEKKLSGVLCNRKIPMGLKGK